jgi:Calcineurin-like phosphoesterase superfamily domain
MGNADRTLIDGRLGSIFDWATTQVTEDDKEFLRGFEQTIAIDDVLYCHSTPTSDEEWITILTPDDLAEQILGEVGYPTLVQGHTHTQFDRMIGSTRVVNAGSVGMGNADEPGAHWLLVEDGEPHHRRTAYDLDVAAARLRESEWPNLEEWLQERVLSPLPPREAAEMVEARRP